MAPLSRPFALVSKRLMEIRLRNSPIVWTDVADPGLAAEPRDDRAGLLDTLVAITLEASPDHSKRKWLRPIFAQWLALNLDVFRLIKIDGDIAGFTCVIPLSDDAIASYRMGRLSEWDFDKPCADHSSAILAPGKTPCRNLCIQAITLREPLWRKYSARTLPLKSLLMSLVEHLATFNPVPFTIKPCLIADGNKRGVHILRNHGFQTLVAAADSTDGRPIFQLDFAAPQCALGLESRMTIATLERLITLSGGVRLASRFFLDRAPSVLLAFLVIDRETLAAALAARTPPTWNIFAVARGATEVDTQALAASLQADVRLTLVDPNTEQSDIWRTLRKGIDGDVVPLICRDREIGHAVSRELFGPRSHTTGAKRAATGSAEPMIDFATAVSAAALLNNSLSSIDKIYDWWKVKEGAEPATAVLRNDPQTQVLQYVSLTDASERPRVVMTYTELGQRLTDEDVRFIKACEQRMNHAMKQWEALNAELPLAGPVERARIEANMENMKDKDICFSLKQIVGFVEELGIDLNDHYASVRSICR